MKYKIFEIEEKRKVKPDGYDLSSTYYSKFKDVSKPYGMRTEFQYPNEAYLEIEKFAPELKHKTLTIIPIVHITYDGQIITE